MEKDFIFILMALLIFVFSFPAIHTAKLLAEANQKTTVITVAKNTP